MVRLLSSTTDPVSRAVDKEIYGDDVERLIKTNRLYFIVRISIAVINLEPHSNICYGFMFSYIPWAWMGLHYIHT